MNNYLEYEISSKFVEQKKITIKNYSRTSCLCKVVINYKLFKLIFLAPYEEEILIYDKEDDIKMIEITDLTESEDF
jgi:hypothetical protein